MSCLDAVAPTACGSSGGNASASRSCWNATVFPNTCAACASKAKSYDVCLGCLQATPFSPDCSQCASLDDNCTQARCFQCVHAAAHPGTGCYTCSWAFPEPFEQQQCMASLADAKLNDDAKRNCVFACMRRCAGPDARAKCMQCLSQPQDNYFDCACEQPAPGADHLAGD
jgi:hypothetical protein